jgi:NTE family protein
MELKQHASAKETQPANGKTKIAIACQGGGSQTAFTAGVLKTFFENEVHRKYDIMSLSGTSGGAVCAALAWYGLLRAANGDVTPIQDRLTEFWEELTAQHPQELFLDRYCSEALRMVQKGWMPTVEQSPADLPMQMAFSMLQSILPRPLFTDLKAMLEKHIDFAEAQSLIRTESPILIVGAADVLTGELKKFMSNKGEICVEAILASAAVPTLFPAVKIGDHYYWDGLFSDNPPIVELFRPVVIGADHVPDEIWIIQINPTTCKKLPTKPADVADRRNQMIGNMSFSHSLEFLEYINLLIEYKAFTKDILRQFGATRVTPVKTRIVKMSEELSDTLDYVTKLSRQPELIARLMRDGEQQGLSLLNDITKSNERQNK